MPKNSAKSPSRSGGAVGVQRAKCVECLLRALPTWMHYGWWDYRAQSVSALAHRIKAAEAGIVPATVASVLSLPPPVDSATPHSLLLMVKLRDADSRSGAPLATMIVPHDLAITELANELAEKFADLGDLSSYSYCNYRNPDDCMEYMLAQPIAAGQPRLRDNGTPIIYELTVRIWSIAAEADEAGFRCYDSGDELVSTETATTRTEGGYKLCDTIGGRHALIAQAIADADTGIDCMENNSQFERGQADVMFECAVADILPTPEERWPPMADIIGHVRYAESPDPCTCRFEWNHWGGGELEVFALRRLPRHPDGIVVRRVQAMPQVYVL
jgi:hypothetical protein